MHFLLINFRFLWWYSGDLNLTLCGDIGFFVRVYTRVEKNIHGFNTLSKSNLMMLSMDCYFYYNYTSFVKHFRSPNCKSLVWPIAKIACSFWLHSLSFFIWRACVLFILRREHCRMYLLMYDCTKKGVNLIHVTKQTFR